VEGTILVVDIRLTLHNVLDHGITEASLGVTDEVTGSRISSRPADAAMRSTTPACGGGALVKVVRLCALKLEYRFLVEGIYCCLDVLLMLCCKSINDAAMSMRRT
jgi:hypothetical protein